MVVDGGIVPGHETHFLTVTSVSTLTTLSSDLVLNSTFIQVFLLAIHLLENARYATIRNANYLLNIDLWGHLEEKYYVAIVFYFITCEEIVAIVILGLTNRSALVRTTFISQSRRREPSGRPRWVCALDIALGVRPRVLSRAGAAITATR
jgi:hypothetical protein